MPKQRILGAILLTVGLLILAYGGFAYTEESHQIDLGVVELEANEKEHVSLPSWLGISSVVVGGLLLVSGRNK